MVAKSRRAESAVRAVKKIAMVGKIVKSIFAALKVDGVFRLGSQPLLRSRAKSLVIALLN